MEKFLKDIGIFFVWVISKFPEIIGLIDIEEKIIFWIFTTGIGLLAIIGIKWFKRH